MKYVATVTKVLKPGIHTVGALRDGEVVKVADLPHPHRLEIDLDGSPDQPCMMYRYTNSGESCGDTWLQTLAEAFAQAAFEYGLSERDFHAVSE